MKINLHKVWATASVCAILGSALVAFQNFVPHDPFKGHDTSDLYMNSALTDALKQAEKDRKTGQAQKLEDGTHASGQSKIQPELGRAPAQADESQTK